jgi:thymidylate synthase
MVPGKFVHTFGDAHIYLNHKTQVNELLKKISPELRDNPEPIDFFENKEFLDKVGNDWPALPQLELNSSIKKIEDFTPKDIEIKNYNPFSKIEAPIAI